MPVQRLPSIDAVTCPFAILVDGREGHRYQFTGITSGAESGHRPIIVPSETCYLKTGDYTIRGMESLVTVERKSLVDLYGTLGQNRERFEDEHKRMAEMRRAVVVIEAGWEEIIHPERTAAVGEWKSKLSPKTVFRTALSWHVKYGIPWMACEDRRFAEIYTFRFLEKCWKEFKQGASS